MVLVEDIRWVDSVVVRNGYIKAIVGYDAGLRCPARLWWAASDGAVTRRFPYGIQAYVST
jgi:hypothetical protein